MTNGTRTSNAVKILQLQSSGSSLICSARRTALGPTRASSELSKVSAMPMERTIYFRFPQPSALGRGVVWCVVRGARAHGRASRPRGGRGSRRRGPAARRFCQIIEKQRFEKGYRTLLTYYMLGSDPALWPAGERPRPHTPDHPPALVPLPQNTRQGNGLGRHRCGAEARPPFSPPSSSSTPPCVMI